MKAIARILPHICIIISGLLLTLVVIDKFNTQMNFIDNSITKNILLVFTVLVVVCSVMLARRQRQED